MNSNFLKYYSDCENQKAIEAHLNSLARSQGFKPASYVNVVYKKQAGGRQYSGYGYLFLRDPAFMHALLNEDAEGKKRVKIVEETEGDDDLEDFDPYNLGSFDWADTAYTITREVELEPLFDAKALTLRCPDTGRSGVLKFERPNIGKAPSNADASVIYTDLPAGVTSRWVRQKVRLYYDEKRGKLNKEDVTFPIIDEYPVQNRRLGREMTRLRYQFDPSTTDARYVMLMVKGLWYTAAGSRPILVSFWNEDVNVNRSMLPPRLGRGGRGGRGGRRGGRPQPQVDADGFSTRRGRRR